MPRIPSLPIGEWPTAMREAIAALRTPNPRHPILTTEGDRPKAMNALGTFANHPALTTAFHTFTGHLLYGTTLSLRQRELIVLRVAAARDCEYEWLQHMVIGEDVGIGRDEIALVRDTKPDEWADAFEGHLLSAVDQLVAVGKISDTTWSSLAATFSTQQLMDLVFTVGGYDALAMALLSFDVDIDADLIRWRDRDA